jgi:type 1 glutamine amidotransferase
MKRVLLVSDGLLHPPYFGRMALRDALAEMDGFEFQVVRSMENLPKNLKDFSALVVYVHHRRISDGALRALIDYVSGGGGLLGIHTATASFKEQVPYFEILGGRFVGHGPVRSFEVMRARGDIFASIENFVVKDELYVHELQPGIEVHFTAKHEGREIPVVWTYRYGKGRICYVVLGHRTATMKHRAMQEVLRRGLTWVCEGEER